jgi:uncharacterized OB-fold protein
MAEVIRPGVDQGNAWFWDGVAQHRFLLQRCTDCGMLRYPAAPMCGACQSLGWDAHEASGRGTVHTWIVSHHPTEDDPEPRIVALVELEEGVRVVSNIVGSDPIEVDNELPVELTFVRYDDVTLPQFQLVRR